MLSRVSHASNLVLRNSTCHSIIFQSNILRRCYAVSKNKQRSKSQKPKPKQTSQLTTPTKPTKQTPTPIQTRQTPATQGLKTPESEQKPGKAEDIVGKENSEVEKESDGAESKSQEWRRGTIQAPANQPEEEQQNKDTTTEEKETENDVVDDSQSNYDINPEEITTITGFVDFMKATTLAPSEIFRVFPNLHPTILRDATSYNEYLQMLLRTKPTQDEVNQVLALMKKNRVSINVRTASLVMGYLGRIGDLEAAVQKIGEWKGIGKEGSMAFVQAAFEKGDTENAFEMIDEVRKLGLSWEFVDTSVSKMISSWKTETVTRACGPYVRDIGEEHVDIMRAIVLAQLFIRSGSVRACQQLFEKFKNSKVTPETSRLFSLIFRCLQTNSAHGQFWNTYNSLRQSGANFDFNMITEVLGNLARMPDPQEKQMLELLEEMEKKDMRPNIYTYEALILGLSRTNIKHARQRFHQMMREDIRPTPGIVHKIVKGYCAAAMTGECIEFLHVVRRAGLPIASGDVQLLLHTLVELSEHQQATHLIEFFNREENWLDMPSCNILATLFTKTKQLEKLESLMATMDKKGVKPDINFYSALAILYTRSGKLLDALGVLRKMTDAQMRLPSDTWRPLVSKLVVDGFMSDAQKVVEIAEMSGEDVAFVRRYLEKMEKFKK